MNKATISSLKFLTIPGLVLLLAGCGGSSSSLGSTPHSVSAKTPSGLTVTLSENASVIPVNGEVTYTLAVTNTTSQPAAFNLESACSQDFMTGTGASRFSGDVQAFNPAGQLAADPHPPCFSIGYIPETLAPGQSLSGTIPSNTLFGTNVFAMPGKYAAIGIVTFLGSAGSQNSGATTGKLIVTVQ